MLMPGAKQEPMQGDARSMIHTTTQASKISASRVKSSFLVVALSLIFVLQVACGDKSGSGDYEEELKELDSIAEQKVSVSEQELVRTTGTISVGEEDTSTAYHIEADPGGKNEGDSVYIPAKALSSNKDKNLKFFWKKGPRYQKGLLTRNVE